MTVELRGDPSGQASERAPSLVARLILFLGTLAVVAVAGLFAFAVVLPLLLPVIQARREALRREQCSENLKRLGEALKNYKQFQAAPRGKTGKPPFNPSGKKPTPIADP